MTMGKEITVKKISDIYNIVSSAKFTKMSDQNKITAWKMIKEIKTIAAPFNEDIEDIKRMFMPYEGFENDLMTGIRYEEAKKNNNDFSEITDEEYAEILEKYKSYQTSVDKAIEDISDRKVTLKNNPLNKEVFEELVCSNDWAFDDIEKIEEVMC